jgi:hypothetical protein
LRRLAPKLAPQNASLEVRGADCAQLSGRLTSKQNSFSSNQASEARPPLRAPSNFAVPTAHRAGPHLDDLSASASRTIQLGAGVCPATRRPTLKEIRRNQSETKRTGHEAILGADLKNQSTRQKRFVKAIRRFARAGSESRHFRKEIEMTKTSEILAAYNAAAKFLGEKPVARFADRKTAERRLAAITARLPAIKPAPTAAAKYVCGTCPKCGDSANGITVGRINDRGQEVDEHVGLCHVCGHTFNYDTGRAAKFSNERAATNGAGVSASWQVAEVRAARIARVHLTANGVAYRSVAKAFAALHLPTSQIQKFRLALKAAGALEFAGHKFATTEKAE